MAQLRESLLFDETVEGLLKLRELTGEDVFPRLCKFAFKGYDAAKNNAAMLAFIKLKEVRAVPMLANVVSQMHVSLDSVIRRINRNETDEPAI